MGEREMILLMGAMFFFAMTTMSINRYCLNNSQVIMESEFNYHAISIAQGIIEEAKTKKFDHVVIATPTRDKDSLTLAADLGREGSVFDDIDDYHYYNENPLELAAEVDGRKVDYTVQVEVGYVQESDPSTVVPSQKFYKKMTVTVTSSYLSNPVVLSHIFSYFEY